MLRRTLFCLFFSIIISSKGFGLNVRGDSLNYFLQLNNKELQQRKLVKYIYLTIQTTKADSLNKIKARFSQLFLKFGIENRNAFNYFVEYNCDIKLSHTNEAENALLKGIEAADVRSDHYLLYTFFSYLAITQTYTGDPTAAIASFRLADKEAIELNDNYLRVLIDINISDMFYRNNFYEQSLFYLNQAMAILAQDKVSEQRLKNVIYFNTAENYFRMNKVDSLKKYNQALNDAKSGTAKLYTFRKRTDYYIYLLNHDYKNAIGLLSVLQKDKLYQFDDLDKKNLADSYFYAGKPDSAKIIIQQLLSESSQNNHPELKFHLFKILGQIAENANDYKLAEYNFKMALQQSENNVIKLTQVGNISSQIKIDEMENTYVQKEQVYRKEKLGFILIVITAIFAIVIIVMFYRNLRQKRHYEQLLFKSQKEELAFLNSHDVRKHLTNILGIINVLKHSTDKKNEYIQVEDRLFYSAEQLDEAIKNISNKLDE